MLGKNRRSTTPILRCAFAVVDKNPPVFAAGELAQLNYRRTPLQSAREEEATTEGRALPSFPVEAISFTGKNAEAPDVVAIIEETKRHSRCKWKDFGILYRSHVHRDEVVQELIEHEIPFSIENMDVSDTPEVRDLFACVAVVVDLGSDASLFRVAALPQFDVNPGAASDGAACDCQRFERWSSRSSVLGAGYSHWGPSGIAMRTTGAR